MFFRNGGQMLAVDVAATGAFTAGRQRILFTSSDVRITGRVNYDVAPDRSSFVMVNSGEADRAITQINVVMNWFDELKRLAPGR